MAISHACASPEAKHSARLRTTDGQRDGEPCLWVSRVGVDVLVGGRRHVCCHCWRLQRTVPVAPPPPPLPDEAGSGLRSTHIGWWIMYPATYPETCGPMWRMGLKRSCVDPPPCSSRACLHTAFMQLVQYVLHWSVERWGGGGLCSGRTTVGKWGVLLGPIVQAPNPTSMSAAGVVPMVHCGHRRRHDLTLVQQRGQKLPHNSGNHCGLTNSQHSVPYIICSVRFKGWCKVAPD